MTWKTLYGRALLTGPGASQELMRRCLLALEGSRPAVKGAIGDTRMAGLFVLCDSLDRLEVPVPPEIMRRSASAADQGADPRA
jgi:hypothetical protein